MERSNIFISYFLLGFLKLQPIIFLKKEDTTAHDKGDLECPKDINNSFLTKKDFLPFAFAGLYIYIMYFIFML